LDLVILQVCPTFLFLASFQTLSYGVMDMAGNVWEWQANYRDQKIGALGLRGGSWNDDGGFARVAIRLNFHPHYRGSGFGFRVFASLPSG